MNNLHQTLPAESDFQRSLDEVHDFGHDSFNGMRGGHLPARIR